MKNKLILITLLQLSISISNAQIGLVKSAGEKVIPKKSSSSTPFNSEFINRYWLAYRSISGYGKSGVERMEYRNSIDVDSAKMCYSKIKANPKKFESPAESFLVEYEKFDANFENTTLSNIEKNNTIDYNNTDLNDKVLAEFENQRLILSAAKDLYSNKSRLESVFSSIDEQQKKYNLQLQSNGAIECPEQFKYLNEFYFSNGLTNSTNCLKGTNNCRFDFPNEGLKIYIFSTNINVFLSKTSLSINNKEVSILLNNSNNNKVTKGWFSDLLIPGLKNVDAYSYYRFEDWVKQGLKVGDTIWFSNSTTKSKNYIVFGLNGYNGDLNQFRKDLKNAFLLTQKPEVPTYKNPTLEKEAIAALEKYQSLNPKEKIGTTVKCVIAGDYWETKKDYNGNPKYQQTNAYFYVKGSDGEYYIVRHTITKDYDIKTKKYGPIKISGFAEKKITHSSYFN